MICADTRLFTMARLASTSIAVDFPRLHPYPVHSHQQLSHFFNLSANNRNRVYQRVFCQTNDPNPVVTGTEEDKGLVEGETSESPANGAAVESASSSSPILPEYPDKSFNRRIALGATLVAVGLFVSKRLDFGVSLKDLTAAAMTYEEALSNGKPTVVEFYADWCEVCRELAPDVYKVEQKYKGQVNFVMLNVDNTKWEQELDEFGVEGIPHFAFLDREGNEEGNVVGRLPEKYLLENVDALARGEASVPHARVVGQFSKAENRKVRPVSDPRSHG